jgi:hypothetical protein
MGHAGSLTKYPTIVQSPGCGKALHLYLFNFGFCPTCFKFKIYISMPWESCWPLKIKIQRKSKAQDAVKHNNYKYYQYGRRQSSPTPHVIHDRHPIVLTFTTTVGGRLTTRTKLEIRLTISRQFFTPTCTVPHTLPPFPSKFKSNYMSALPFWYWHYLITSIFASVGGQVDTLRKYAIKFKSPGYGKALHLSLFQLSFCPTCGKYKIYFSMCRGA